MTIRPTRPEEAALLSDLALRSQACWGYAPDFLERAIPALAIDTADITRRQAFVAERAGGVFGFYCLEGTAPEFGLGLVFVAPEHTGIGVGATLFEHAKMEVRRRQGTALLIESNPNAEAFYVRMGAEHIADVPSESEAGRRLPLLRLQLLRPGRALPRRVHVPYGLYGETPMTDSRP